MPVDHHRRPSARRKWLPSTTSTGTDTDTGAFPSFSMEEWESERYGASHASSTGSAKDTRRRRQCDLGGMGRVRQLVDTVQKLNCAAATMAEASSSYTNAMATATLQRGGGGRTTLSDHADLNDTTLDETTVHSSVFFPVVFTEDDPPPDDPPPVITTHHSTRRTRRQQRHETAEPQRGTETTTGTATTGTFRVSSISSRPRTLSMRRGLSVSSLTEAYAHLSGGSSCSGSCSDSCSHTGGHTGGPTSQVPSHGDGTPLRAVANHENRKHDDDDDPNEQPPQQHEAYRYFDERCFTYSPCHDPINDVPPVQEGFVIEIPNHTGGHGRTSTVATAHPGRTRAATTSIHYNGETHGTIGMFNDTYLHELLVYHPTSTDFTIPTRDTEIDSHTNTGTGIRTNQLHRISDRDNDSSPSPAWIQRPGWDSPDDPPTTPRMLVPFQPLRYRDQPPPLLPLRQVSPARSTKTCFFVPAAMAGSSSRSLSKKLYTELHKPVALRSRASSSTTVSGATCSQTTMTPSTPSSSNLDNHQHHPYHYHAGMTGSSSFISSSSTLGTLEQQWLVSTFTSVSQLPTLFATERSGGRR